MGLGGRIYSGGINCAISAQQGVRNRPYKGMELLQKPVSAGLATPWPTGCPAVWAARPPKGPAPAHSQSPPRFPTPPHAPAKRASYPARWQGVASFSSTYKSSLQRSRPALLRVAAAHERSNGNPCTGHQNHGISHRWRIDRQVRIGASRSCPLRSASVCCRSASESLERA